MACVAAVVLMQLTLSCKISRYIHPLRTQAVREPEPSATQSVASGAGVQTCSLALPSSERRRTVTLQRAVHPREPPCRGFLFHGRIGPPFVGRVYWSPWKPSDLQQTQAGTQGAAACSSCEEAPIHIVKHKGLETRLAEFEMVASPAVTESVRTRG
jgi:hypothetical protein